MSYDDHCPKYPSMLKAFCSHCQGVELGTWENPVFSLKEDFYLGWPVVEVLKNGGPIHGHDSKFRFGIRKAQMIVMCMDVLREFWYSDDKAKLAFKPRIIQDREYGLRVQTFVEMQPDFELSSGDIVNRPWLRLQALPPDKEHLGLGAMKCRALYALKNDIQRWLERQGALRHSPE